MATLSELLPVLLRRAGVGTQTLSKLTGIPRTSIENWRSGSARRPSDWRPLLQIARVLLLAPAEVDALLVAAGFPPVATLARDLPAGHPDRMHLSPWLEAPHAGAGPTLVAPLHQLRTPLADFVGQQAAILTLLETMRETTRVGAVAAIGGVRGMGGVGKTELAYLVAHGVIDLFPDAQIVVPLQGTSADPLPPEQALRHVIHAITPDARLPDNLVALQAHYQSALHGQRALILADDAADAAQVRPLLPPPGCALLVTTRQRFTLPGMTTVDLEPLGAEEAVTLLRVLCDRCTVEDARRLAQICGYLPLALRVSGSILHNDTALPVAAYIAKLEDVQQRLIRLRDPDDAQLDVAAALALSYTRLDAPLQRVFRQLGVIVGDFGTDLALSVVEPAAAVDTEALLHRLLRRNLLIYDPTRARWRLHDLVRDLAQRELGAEEREATLWRYARAAVQIAQEVQHQYLAGGDEALTALARFDTERLHLDAARTWAAAHEGTADGDALLIAAASACDGIGDLSYDLRRDRIPQLETALLAARRLTDQRAEGIILNRLGRVYLDLGNPDRARGYFTERLTIAQALRDRRDESAALNNLGIAYWQLGDLRRAIHYYEQDLAIVREIGDRRGESITLGNLGLAYLDLGDAEHALAALEHALHIIRALGDRPHEANTLGNLGLAYAFVGDLQRAIGLYGQALVLIRAIGDRCGEGRLLNNLGLAFSALGDPLRTIEHGTGALARSREVGDQREEGYALMVLGVGYAALNNYARAQPAFEAALALLRAIGDRRGEAEGSWRFGLMLAGHGERERALPLLHSAVMYETEIGHAHAAAHAALLAQLEAGATLVVELLPQQAGVSRFVF